MKKFFALVLALCMMMTVLPAIAEGTEEKTDPGLDEQITEILEGEGTTEEKAGKLLTLLSALKERFTGRNSEFRVVLSALKQKLESKLGPAKEKVESLLSKAKDKLKGSSVGNVLGGLLGGGEEGEGDLVSGLLGGLLGGGDAELSQLLDGLDQGGETPAEDDETIAETIERLNRESEAATGFDVPNRKPAESVEEFYGDWIESKFSLNGEDYDMSEYNEGVHIAENTYYITLDGAKSADYQHPETAELTLREGTLKVHTTDDDWSTFVLTEAGELVQVGSSLLFYYVPAAK